jgi:hypothetical protein
MLPKKLLQRKLHEAILHARDRLTHRQQLSLEAGDV